MKQNKFRVWSKKTNEYFYSGFLIDSDGLTIYLNGGQESGDLILEQYTGLKDKNGKEVYEGDLIQYENHISNIFWSDVDFECLFFNKILKEYSSLCFLSGFKDFEIIGSIHENPELIGQD